MDTDASSSVTHVPLERLVNKSMENVMRGVSLDLLDYIVNISVQIVSRVRKETVYAHPVLLVVSELTAQVIAVLAVYQ